MLRRTLLILVTGLIVARPLILGEDINVQLDHLDTSTLLLTMLWFVAAVMWAVWRLWSRQGTWYGGILEAALFAVVLLTFTGAVFVAPYKHAARIMSWEWLAMAVGFVLVRQLAITKEEQHCFFAVLLAGIVPLSVYALYQRGVEIPHMQELYGNNLDKLRDAQERQTGQPLEDDTLLKEAQKRLQMTYVYGPYANPNSFASYLSLLIPGLIGAALLCARHKHPRWQVMFASSFATLGVVALGLTISRGAWLAMLLTGLGVVALLWRGWLRTHWYYALGTVVVLALLAVGAWQMKSLWTSGVGKTEETALVRFKEYWPATMRMIADHPWFGVGPGMFGRYYPRYMGPNAGETIKEPHNFALEIWATCGLFALIALLMVLVLFYWRALRALLSAPTVDGPGDISLPDPRTSNEVLPVRWEFYVGGMFGLLLAFVLRVSESSQDEILIEAVKAGVGSVFWFGSFALFEQILWSNRARLLALTAGITAALLNMLVSGGINFPSIAGLIWCAAALALNAADLTPNAWASRFKPLLYAPLPLLAGVAVLYLLLVYYPVTTSLSVEKRSLAKKDEWKQTAQKDLAKNRPLAGSLQRFFPARKEIIDPIDKAMREEDPDNVRLPLVLADLEAEQWRESGSFRQLGSTETSKKWKDKAVEYARIAQRIDPEGLGGYTKEYELHQQFAWGWELPHKMPALFGLGARMAELNFLRRRGPSYEEALEERKKEYHLATDALKKVIEKDPFNPRWYYQLASCLYRAEEPDEARRYAEQAGNLSNRNTWSTRSLSKEQKEQLQRWLAAKDEH
jgi:O-Antigen ligase